MNIRKEEKIKRMERLNDLFMKDRSSLVLEESEILTENSGVAADKLTKNNWLWKREPKRGDKVK